MDLNEIWQANKRFIVASASGVVIFGVGLMLVDHFFGESLARERRVASTAEQKLRTESMYTADQLAAAQQENEELARAVDELARAAAFTARPAFRVDPARGSAGNQYFGAVSSTREQLLQLAGRANMRLQEDLGLPALSPTKDAEIVRYLEALDLVDRAARTALLAGVERIDKIEIKLDPRLASRQGVGEIERTRVELTMSGKAGPLVRFLALSQDAEARAAGGLEAWPALLVEKVEMTPARSKPDEATLEATLVAARLAPSVSGGGAGRAAEAGKGP